MVGSGCGRRRGGRCLCCSVAQDETPGAWKGACEGDCAVNNVPMRSAVLLFAGVDNFWWISRICQGCHSTAPSGVILSSAARRLTKISETQKPVCDGLRQHHTPNLLLARPQAIGIHGAEMSTRRVVVGLAAQRTPLPSPVHRPGHVSAARPGTVMPRPAAAHHPRLQRIPGTSSHPSSGSLPVLTQPLQTFTSDLSTRPRPVTNPRATPAPPATPEPFTSPLPHLPPSTRTPQPLPTPPQPPSQNNSAPSCA